MSSRMFRRKYTNTNEYAVRTMIKLGVCVEHADASFPLLVSTVSYVNYVRSWIIIRQHVVICHLQQIKPF